MYPNTQNALNPTAYSVNLPTEGTVFRDVGDNTNSTLYTVRNGQVVPLAPQFGWVALGNFRGADGTVVQAGQTYNNVNQQQAWTPLDWEASRMSGGIFRQESNPAQWYDQQNGQGSYASLPTYNMADIQNYIGHGGTLGTTPTATMNTQKNSLATPDQYAKATAAQQQQLAPYQGQNVTIGPDGKPITSPLAPAGGTGGTAGTPTTGGTPSTAGAGLSAASTQLQSLLASSNLSADQKKVIQSIYDAVASNDKDYAARISSAMQAATQYSDPYFKSQIRIALDGLERGLQAQAGDLSFKESQLSNTLSDLTNQTASAKDYLTFQQQQELKDLQSKYQEDLQSTQDQLAASGLTSSSIRSRKEKLLGDSYNGMVESKNKAFQYQTGNLDQKLGSAQRDTSQQMAYYQQLAAQNKLDALRKAEQTVGSTNLSGYSNILGNIGGEIPRQQAQDALSFANSYVF